MIRDPFYKEAADTKRFPMMSFEKHGKKYIELAMNIEQKNQTTSRLEADKIRQNLLKANPDVNEKRFEDIWGRLWLKLQSNVSLTQFLLDFGSKSQFFVPWLLNIPRSITLEVAYGYGYDMSGRYRKIPEDDPFFIWTLRDGMFTYLRERSVTTAQTIEGRKKVMFIGAGFLPELRHVGYEADLNQKIIASDIDPFIDADKLFEGRKNKPNITYKTLDLWEPLVDEKNHNAFDAVVMNGLISYKYDDIAKIIESCVKLLTPGGVFIFDLQLKHWTLIRDALVFDWKTNPPMKLVESEEEAINVVQQICKDLPVDIEVLHDSNSVPPTGVMFHVTKH